MHPRLGRLVGVDVVALLAFVGALAIREWLAAGVITLMVTTGRVLEHRASRRAQRDLSALRAVAPRRAHRIERGVMHDVGVDDVAVGDLLLVRPGEIVPVDGIVCSAFATFDESTLTGEAAPVERPRNTTVRSGVTNIGGPFELRATRCAAQSAYAGIVDLVEQADASSAPFVRLADRYAQWFLLAAIVTAGGAWLWSGDPARAVAVLVVATPCPLLLAAPVAIVSGISRAARLGVVVKDGATFERLGDAQVLLFDKTGTITAGQPVVTEVVSVGGWPESEVLRLAASVDQATGHVLAEAVTSAARQRELTLTIPAGVEEVAGHGVRGIVDSMVVSVGNADWVTPGASTQWARAARRHAEFTGSLAVFVSVDGEPIGAILLDDPIRTDAARTLRRLRRAGIRRCVMVTGDRREPAQQVATVIGADDVLAERSPAEKVEAVRIEQRIGTTVMVGDGINDAPALALADVGVAMASRGSGIASDAADVVLVVDHLDRLADTMLLARRGRRIALQSVIGGIGVSVLAMGFAAGGLLVPAIGAVVQEAIDLAAIANALRVRRSRPSAATLTGDDATLTRRFTTEHSVLFPDIQRLRTVADALDTHEPLAAVAAVRPIHRFLVEVLEPHELAEDSELYPVLARAIGGHDPTATMSRAHAEIVHLIHRIGRVLDEIDPAGPERDDIVELRHLLYGLHAVLVLHFAQEDEGYLSLAEAPEPIAH